MGRFSVWMEREVVSEGFGVGGMEGFWGGRFIYLPVEDIVASWRAGLKETGVRRIEVEECLKAFVKQ